MLLAILCLLLWQHGFFPTSVAIVEPPHFEPHKNHSFVIGYGQYLFTQWSIVLSTFVPAPLIWFDIGEQYYPSNISAQIQNTHPVLDSGETIDVTHPLDMNNLDSLNTYGNSGRNIYLSSNNDITTRPTWLIGSPPDASRKAGNTKSCAIIINNHGKGLVDVFYMYFYAFNMGSTVLFQELGNHVGDWEHNMIRFQDGRPTAIWFSQHANGEAFTYEAVKKKGVRPMS
jgi:hypothetical protein